MTTPARLIAPYYALLLPSLLVGAGTTANHPPPLVALADWCRFGFGFYCFDGFAGSSAVAG